MLGIDGRRGYRAGDDGGRRRGPASIEQQVRAAGLNQLTITRRQLEAEDGRLGGAVAHQGDAGTPAARRAEPSCPRGDPFAARGRVLHPEDDPMEKHDHPLGLAAAGRPRGRPRSAGDAVVRRRRGDPRARLACSTWPAACTGTRGCTWRPSAGSPACTAPTSHLPTSSATWTLPAGRFFTEARADRRRSRCWCSARSSPRSCSVDRRRRRSARQVTLWNQPFEVIGVVTSSSWVVRPAPGDDEFDAVYMPYTTTHRLLNLSKLNDITMTAASSGEVTRCRARSRRCFASATASATTTPDDFTISTQATGR